MASLRGGNGILDSATAYTGDGTATSSTYYASPTSTQHTWGILSTTNGSVQIYGISSVDRTTGVAIGSAVTVTANTIKNTTVSGTFALGYYAIFTDTSHGAGTVTFAIEGEAASMGGVGGGQTAGS